MCGIIGVTGSDDAPAIVLRGLENLEYRGYDSAGVAIVEPGADRIWHRRAAERARSLEVLRPVLADAPTGAAIGHTRWATHGAPTEQNAHPHLDCSATLAVVHNGILENHRGLRAELVARGHTFSSDTDTEVVAHLLEESLATGASLFRALQEIVGRLEGDFAIAAVATAAPDVIVAARRTAPLIVGMTDSVGVVGSDIAALLPVTRDLYLLGDDEIAEVRPGAISVVDLAGQPVTPKPYRVTWSVEDAQKGGYPDFMSKEIREQPEAIAETLLGRLHVDGSSEFEELAIAPELLSAVERVILIGCGSSYHASLIARHAIERLARIPAEVDIASEFRFRDTVLDERTLVVAVSQSGETIDTLHALRHAQKGGARTLTVTNVVDSGMAREADGVIYLHAGPEIGVASTKATMAQIALLETLAVHLAHLRGSLSSRQLATEASSLISAPRAILEVIERIAEYEAVARRYAGMRDVFFLGRGIGYPIALEGALKLKELAYLRAEAYPAGELKHGPIALIDERALVVAVTTNLQMREKVISNIEEVRARGAVILSLSVDGDEAVAALSDATMEVPAADDLVVPMVGIVPLQCLAYAIARELGNDVDRPRNLAKVVTVE